MEPRDLYGLPLDRFVAERGALAKSLRADGKRDEAAEVAKLRKPSVAAWAVNQLVRTQSRELKALFKAGDQLQRAQADLLAGKGDAGKLRAAAEREREAVDELTEAARGLLSSEGHELAPATLDRVSDTLHAAALDKDARGEVAGRLPRARASPRRPRRVRGAAGKSGPPRARDRGSRCRAPGGSEGRGGSHPRPRARRPRVETAQARRDRAADALREAEEALAAAGVRAEEAALAHARAAEQLKRP